MHSRVVAATRTQLDGWRPALAGGARRVGWKIARDFAEIEAVIGDVPVIGHLTRAMRLPAGSVFDARGGRELRAETELAIEVGRPGAAVALEIVDVARPPDGLEGSIAANGTANGPHTRASLDRTRRRAAVSDDQDDAPPGCGPGVTGDAVAGREQRQTRVRRNVAKEVAALR